MRRPGLTYAFGDFRLDPHRRVLSRAAGQVLPMSSSALDTLLFLVEHPGEIVGRGALLEAVWPHATVVDNSVNQAVSAVRHALGDAAAAPRYVTTIPGRGYRFAAAVALEDEAARDPSTYQLYVAGWSALTRPTPSNLVDAERNLQQAIGRDPGFTLALTALAECFILQASHLVRPALEAFPKARAAAEAALEIDPQSAEAWAAISQIQFTFDFDPSTAALSMARALELNPRCFVAYRFLGRQLMVMGRFEEALAAHRRALTIEPLAASINGNIGMTLYAAGRYEEAIAQFEHALRMDENWVVARGYLGRCHLQLGDFERAIAEFTHPTSLQHGRPGDLPIAYALSGRTAEARALLASLMRRANSEMIPPLEVAMIHAALREDELALDWIERAIHERYSTTMSLAVEPTLLALHAHPRFRVLLARLGLRLPEADLPDVS